MATLRPCGTEAAYYRHRRRGETPCDECRRGRAEHLVARGVTRKVFKAGEHGTNYMYSAGCRCDDCRRARRDHQREYRRRVWRERNTPTIAETIGDILHLNMLPLTTRGIIDWCQEVHPEWKEDSIRQALHRMAADGRVVSVERGMMQAWRLP